MSISDPHLKCHSNNKFISFHAWASDDQREPNTNPCCNLHPYTNTGSSCLAFFWVQVYVIEILPAAVFFMWWTLGVMCCRNGRGGGIPQGEQGISFICRLPSCLLQIFHKVLRFWHESKNNFYTVSPFHLKLCIIHQEPQSSPLQNGEDSGMIISVCLMLFRKPVGSAAYGKF